MKPSFFGGRRVKSTAAASAHQGLAFPKPQKRERKASKREARSQASTARARLRIRAIERAKGRCENPSCRADLHTNGAIMDHWLGGIGRRVQQERLETVWMLCLRCNKDRTDNSPSATYWNMRFSIHCRAHGYSFTPHNTR